MILDADGNVLVRQIGFLVRMRRETVVREPIDCIATDRVDVDVSGGAPQDKLTP